jgi:hypothetical protein
MLLLFFSVVTFNHRSVFPVMFDGSAVEKWWKSALVFKLYSRTAGQKVVGLNLPAVCFLITHRMIFKFSIKNICGLTGNEIALFLPNSSQ